MISFEETHVHTRTSNKKSQWTEAEIQEIIDSYTNPIGKFFRDSNLTAKRVVELDLMKDLQNAPRKIRKKSSCSLNANKFDDKFLRYGPRQDMSMEERARLTKERNREHAKATRLRKKLFQEVHCNI